MKSALIGKLVARGKAKEVKTGFIFKRGTGMFVIDLTAELNRSFTVEATSEADARTKVAAQIENESVRPLHA